VTGHDDFSHAVNSSDHYDCRVIYQLGNRILRVLDQSTFYPGTLQDRTNKRGYVRVCIKVTLRRDCLTIAPLEKKVIITYSQCVSVALVIQHDNRILPVIFSSVA
jgi:hypothetical protein